MLARANSSAQEWTTIHGLSTCKHSGQSQYNRYACSSLYVDRSTIENDTIIRDGSGSKTYFAVQYQWLSWPLSVAFPPEHKEGIGMKCTKQYSGG